LEGYSIYTPTTLQKKESQETAKNLMKNRSENSALNNKSTSREAKKMQYYMRLFERAEKREAKKERRKKTSTSEIDPAKKVKGRRGIKRKAATKQSTASKLPTPVNSIENEWENVDIQLISDDIELDQECLATFYNSGSNNSNSNYQELEGMSLNDVNTSKGMMIKSDRIRDLLPTSTHSNTNTSCIKGSAQQTLVTMNQNSNMPVDSTLNTFMLRSNQEQLKSAYIMKLMQQTKAVQIASKLDINIEPESSDGCPTDANSLNKVSNNLSVKHSKQLIDSQSNTGRQ